MPAPALQISTESYNPIESAPFNPIPRIVSRRLDLSLGAKLVYGYLAGCYGYDGLICPRVSRIAFETGIGERQVGRCLDELREKNLIVSVRTGRANRYFFVPLDDAPGRSARPCVSTVSDPTPTSDHDPTPTSDQPVPTPLLENKTEKAVVVSLDAGEIHQAVKEIRPDVKVTKSIRRTIRQGIVDHGLDAVLLAIRYTNERSQSHYGAYLHKAISSGWADGWTPTRPPPPQQDPAEIERQEAEQTALFAREQAEVVEERDRAARKFMEMTKSEKIEIREKFLSEAPPLIQRRCQRMDLDALGESLSFRYWLMGRE